MSAPAGVKATTSTYRMYVQTKKSLLNVNNTFNKVTLDHSPTTFRFNLYTILNFHKNRCLVLLSFNRVSLEEKNSIMLELPLTCLSTMISRGRREVEATELKLKLLGNKRQTRKGQRALLVK